MIVTPSNSGALIAGAGVGIFGWSVAEKGDKVPYLNRFYTTVRKEKMFAWAAANKGMALLALEAINFAIHGITDANAVIFALGNTVINAIGLHLYLPFRQSKRDAITRLSVLQGVKQ